MMSHLKIVLCAMVLIFISHAQPGLAETNGLIQEIPDGSVSSQKGSAVVADVNVTDVVMTEKDGVLAGTFALQGRMGQQNDIAYGVVVIDTEGQTLDIQPLGYVDSVREGEIKVVPFEYNLPPLLKGSVKILLRAETMLGLPLGTQVLLERDFGGTYKRVLTCSDAQDGISCTSLSNQVIKIDYYTGSVFSQSVENDEASLVANQVSNINASLKPGRYTAVIKGSVTGSFASASFRVIGTFGQIQNVAIHTNESEELVGSVVAVASPLIGTTVEMELYSENSQICGQGSAVLDSQVAEIVFNDVTCVAGTVKTILKGADGSVLASLSQSFNASDITVTKPLEQIETQPLAVSPSSSGLLKWLFLLGGIIVLMSLVFLVGRVVMSKGDATVPKIFFLAFAATSFLSLIPEAHALTLMGTTYGPRGCTGCEIGIASITDISTNNSTYIPGATIGVTSSHRMTKDVGSIGLADRGVINIGYPSQNGSTPQWDVDLGQIGGSPAFNMVSILASDMPYAQSGVTQNFTIPSNMIAGQHFLSNRTNLEFHDSAGVVQNSVHVGRLYFDVVTSCAYANADVSWSVGTNNVAGVPGECRSGINVSNVPIGQPRSVTDNDVSTASGPAGSTGAMNFICTGVNPGVFGGFEFTGSNCAVATPPTVNVFW